MRSWPRAAAEFVGKFTQLAAIIAMTSELTTAPLGRYDATPMAFSHVKPEFPPLLTPGFHSVSLGEVRGLCVTKFPTSLTRRAIMDGLRQVIRKLNEADIEGELWLDGSFLTEKIDPEDVDYLLCVGSDIYDVDPAKRAVIDWASHADLKTSHLCDAYKWVEYKPGHPLFAYSEDERRYWADFFGTSRKKIRKGIAVVTLPAVSP
jgi:Family of unknown function (DUF6932)